MLSWWHIHVDSNSWMVWDGIDISAYFELKLKSRFLIEIENYPIKIWKKYLIYMWIENVHVTVIIMSDNEICIKSICGYIYIW